MIYYLAKKTVKLYTTGDPKVFYFTVNSAFSKEYYEHFPILYPLVNLMDIAIRNFYDVSANLDLEQ